MTFFEIVHDLAMSNHFIWALFCAIALLVGFAVGGIYIQEFHLDCSPE
ncbi:hypothetical protein LCGC14_2976890 [marine sediment metagenome]|uniref:Uncharacterized protein n=1 Tax=marine sediment metagenome TaxID=412755 RepID=A0A0F8ZF99_9ZZZZ